MDATLAPKRPTDCDLNQRDRKADGRDRIVTAVTDRAAGLN
jgi:hypothetical protein